MESGPAVHPRVRDQLQARLDTGDYDEILALWKAHSIAEDARDLDGLVATLAPDCVYELVGGDVEPGHRWEGHEGARRFYTEFLGAFPDVAFFLQDITVGPQGVTEVARVSATQVGSFAGWPATGEPVTFTVVIVFPWDPVSRRFRGERVLAVRGDAPGGDA
ncbi:nuclear transport factor 2 family protein [Salsipaludibacter albus]|uniref:nuclear transport factor 2 family protein n=1 Tax=Salsipaludibacter albus TaxID=2849650 RepID=UPI001EE4787B|nr:nuclear transport factor 2 family protein [Salsipaludibacter albus]MBY5163786.1 nuclear transport factor 2 family protein [Salsipaludibacter albus]